MFIIEDWAGNHCFQGRVFDTFTDAWGFLYSISDSLNEADFNAEMSEYEVVEVG